MHTADALQLGIALYHRLPFDELVERCAPVLLELLGAPARGNDLQLWLGDEPRGAATRQDLAGVELHELTRGRDRPLTIAPKDAPRGHAPWALVHDPKLVQRRAVRTHLLAAVVPAETFRRETFERLCLAIDVRYGFATVATSVDAALDEALWPDAPGRRADSAARRHSDAWLQLMRSFGRPDIDHGVPDIYWCNVFGNLLVNELRKLECWDALESHAELHYLDNGAVVFQLSPEPRPESEPENARRARDIGDIVAPLGLLQRVLLQARQGDLLLLEALVATGDQRLLPGLLFPQGLDAFRRLAGPDAADLETLEQARNYLERTATDRPRGYGEAPSGRGEEEDPKLRSEAPEVPPQGGRDSRSESQGGLKGWTNDGARDGAAVAGGPVAGEPSEARAPAFDRDSPQWRIDSMTRGALRLDLGSLRWTPGESGARRLEAALVNDLPCPAELRGLHAVVLRHGAPHALCRTALEPVTLAGSGATQAIALEVPAPTPEDELLVVTAFSVQVRRSVADIVVEDDGSVRLLSASPGTGGASLVHDAWPARVLAAVTDGNRLVLQLTNAMQQPWSAWSLALIAADNPESRHDAARSQGILDAGHTTWTLLETAAAAATASGNLQLWLEARCEVELTVAGFGVVRDS